MKCQLSPAGISETWERLRRAGSDFQIPGAAQLLQAPILELAFSSPPSFCSWVCPIGGFSSPHFFEVSLGTHLNSLTAVTSSKLSHLKVVFCGVWNLQIYGLLWGGSEQEPAGRATTSPPAQDIYFPAETGQDPGQL